MPPIALGPRRFGWFPSLYRPPCQSTDAHPFPLCARARPPADTLWPGSPALTRHRRRPRRDARPPLIRLPPGARDAAAATPRLRGALRRGWLSTPTQTPTRHAPAHRAHTPGARAPHEPRPYLRRGPASPWPRFSTHGRETDERVLKLCRGGLLRGELRRLPVPRCAARARQHQPRARRRDPSLRSP